MRFYRSENNALVYCEKKANPDYWDDLWIDDAIQSKMFFKNRYLLRLVKKYLIKGSRILEGGCGCGSNVYHLEKSGYRAYGIDYAPKTVSIVKKNIPALSLLLGDVRKLPLKRDSFQGYVSVGVIEHFYNGYKEIAEEMKRVLDNGGYLFLSFPQMSAFRKLKARMKKYPELGKKFDPEADCFYQYALDRKKVQVYFEQKGFKKLSHKFDDGIKGLKDEVRFLRPVLQKIYDSRSISAKIIKRLLNLLLNRFFGHSVILVLQKTMV